MGLETISSESAANKTIGIQKSQLKKPVDPADVSPSFAVRQSSLVA
jgi:hypothetical protein